MTEEEYIDAIEQVIAGERPVAPEAIRLVDEAVERCPRSAEVWLLRGELLELACIEAMQEHGRADFGEADRSFRTAIELDPTSSEAWSCLGAFLDIIEDLDGAEAAYRRALELSHAREALVGLARVLVQQERWMEVLDLLDPNVCAQAEDEEIGLIRGTVADFVADPAGADHPLDVL